MKTQWILICLILLPLGVSAHHGVASLGVAGLEGPGAPVECSSSATLPQGAWLGMIKLDYAVFDTYTAAIDDEGDRNAFWIYGLGYGLGPGVSIYGFVPYSIKKTEDNSFNSAGFADISLMGVFGFKYDGGLRRIPANESLDDLEDWHFTLYGGFSLPTGDADFSDRSGGIDPGMSLGFGGPSYSAGLSMTGLITPRLTAVTDISRIGFREHEYADGNTMRFGLETRLNQALVLRLLSDGARTLRLDANLEANWLSLGRDRANGIDEVATGGRMLYLLPGLRLSFGKSSLGLGYKVPVWTDLNEQSQQQGAEGRETGRVVLTLSTLF